MGKTDKFYKGIRCNFCGREIHRAIEMKVHVNIEHLDNKRVFCSQICKFAWIVIEIRKKQKPVLFKGPWFHANINK